MASEQPDPIQAARLALVKLQAHPLAPKELGQVLGGLLDHMEKLGARLQAIEKGAAGNEGNNRHGRVP